MEQQEKDDLATLKTVVAQRKIQYYDYLSSSLHMDADTLRCCGHKSIESALMFRIKAAEKEIEKLTAEYLKKYPD